MGFKIMVSEDSSYIVGKVDGQFTLKAAQQLAEEYTKLIESTGIKRILNDVRGAQNEIRDIEGYHYAYEKVKEIGLPRDIRAAIVVDKNDSSYWFQETVALNAGYSVKVFFSYDQAVRWLTKDDF